MVKKGFSLMEALVVMAVIAVFFSAAAKVITTKPKPQKLRYYHGYYECYLQSGSQHSLYVRDDVAGVVKDGACNFVPPVGVPYFNINAYIANGGEGVSFTSSEPSITNNLTITLGTENIVISSQNGTFNITSDANNSTRDSLSILLNTLFPNSHVYNEGNLQTGIIISW